MNWLDNMPYRECFQRSTVPKLFDDHHFSGKNKDWTPLSSQVNARERLRFQTYSDKLSGGIQYWHKRKPSEPGAWTSTRKSQDKPFNVSQHPKCTKCGGLLSDQSNLRTHFNERHSCAFGKEYCEVIGPCANCCLTDQRKAIVEKQTVEFPGLEVTPRRLVAPALVQAMMANGGDNVTELDHSHQSRSILELPPISLDTLRYMRREAGSCKQKRKSFTEDHQKQSFKKYIEIRLPKIWRVWMIKVKKWSV